MTYLLSIRLSLSIMTAPNNNFWFRPGRREKEGRKNPGILAVDDKYEFVAHSNNKEGTEYVYVCKFRQTVKIKCSGGHKVSGFNLMALNCCLTLKFCLCRCQI